MKTIFLVVSLMLIIILSGCVQQEAEIVCNKPYILVGNECCLDANDNSICDRDEVTTTTTTLENNLIDTEEEAIQFIQDLIDNNETFSFLESYSNWSVERYNLGDYDWSAEFLWGDASCSVLFDEEGNVFEGRPICAAASQN